MSFNTSPSTVGAPSWKSFKAWVMGRLKTHKRAAKTLSGDLPFLQFAMTAVAGRLRL